MHKIRRDINHKRNKNNILVYSIVNNGSHRKKYKVHISLTFNQWVTGSNPVRLTTEINDLAGSGLAVTTA